MGVHKTLHKTPLSPCIEAMDEQERDTPTGGGGQDDDRPLAAFTTARPGADALARRGAAS